MGTKGYYAGVLCGLLAGIAAAVLLRLRRKRRTGESCRYDERQRLAQGLAYKAAYFVLFIYIFLATLLEGLEITGMLMSFAGLWLGVCISVSVFAVICIWKDAYLALHERAGMLLVTFGAVFIFNLVITADLLLSGTPMLADGKLAPESLNLAGCMMTAVILAVFLVKLRRSKRLEEEDEGE